MKVQKKVLERNAFGLYVHAPFCSSTCDFCAFYQEKPRKNSVKTFLEGLTTEWSLVSKPPVPDTIFVGGGTPGALQESDFARFFDILRELAGDRFVEWSVELAPAETTPAKLRVLRESGVTRVSLGVQSFQPSMLQALGRRHPPDQARRAFDWMREAGFDNLNLDLIFCIPGQELSDWRLDLETAVSWEPDHLSTYCLIHEEKAALFAQVKTGEIGPDPEREEKFYLYTWEFLKEAGFEQYEVANFARSGKRCRHNWNVWRMNEWIGLGPSAASQWQGERWSNVASLQAWSDALSLGCLTKKDVVSLGPLELAEDYLLFGLRLNEGIDLRKVAELCPEADLEPLRLFFHQLGEEGLTEARGDGFRVTDRGRLLVDRIGSEVAHRFASVA